MSETFGTTRGGWFLRGAVVGLIVFASATAVSYFAQSDGWGNLLGTQANRREALGFPRVAFEKRSVTAGYIARYDGILTNLLCAVGLAALLGLAMMSQSGWLNRVAEKFGPLSSEHKQPPKIQFSLRNLLINMAIAAAGAAVLRLAFGRKPLALGLIYALGPLFLIIVAMLPRKIDWRRRVTILVPLTMLLIVAALLVGGSLERSLLPEEVLLGIFICWTPQTGLVAVVLAAVTLLAIRHSQIQAAT